MDPVSRLIESTKCWSTDATCSLDAMRYGSSSMTTRVRSALQTSSSPSRASDRNDGSSLFPPSSSFIAAMMMWILSEMEPRTDPMYTDLMVVEFPVTI